MSAQPSQEKFRIAAKKRLIDRGLTITGLAASIGYSRNAVSMAINRPVFAPLRSRIAKELQLECA